MQGFKHASTRWAAANPDFTLESTAKGFTLRKAGVILGGVTFEARPGKGQSTWVVEQGERRAAVTTEKRLRLALDMVTRFT